MTRVEAATGVIERAANRAWRELTARARPLGWAVDRRHDQKVHAYRGQLAPLPSAQLNLLQDIAVTGVAVTNLDALGLSGVGSLKEPLERLARTLAERDPTAPCTLLPTAPELLAAASVWQWGLREDVLDFVEGYLRLPARYYGPEVRRERADGLQNEVRQWHLDVEDHRVFRLLVWISDVGPTGGAFEWIPREMTRSTARELGYVSGYRTESQMANVVPRSQWRNAAGPRWTTVLADTHSVFHRAGTPEEDDRYSVMFTWTSRWPVKTTPTRRLTLRETAKLQEGLNGRQLARLAPPLLAR
jgi:hypothetical protein